MIEELRLVSTKQLSGKIGTYRNWRWGVDGLEVGMDWSGRHLAGGMAGKR